MRFRKCGDGMFQTLNKISGKKQITRARIEKVMNDNTVLFCRSIHRLYDLGFTCSPFYINEIDFRLAVQQEYEDELVLLRSPLDGRVTYNERALKYVQYATKNDEFREVIGLYHDYLMAQRKLHVCEEALNTMKFKRGKVADVSVRLGVTGGIVDKTKAPLLPEFLLTDEQPYMWERSIAPAVMSTMCGELGITNEVLLAYQSKNRPLFLSEISSEQEYEIADIILHGKLPLNGDYGEKLRGIMVDYYNKFMLENTRVSLSQLSFESYIYNKSESSYSSVLKILRDRLADFDVNEIYMTSDTVYYKSSKSWKNNVREYCILPVGMYSNEFTPDLFKGVQGIFSEEKDDLSTPVFLTDCGVRYVSRDVDFMPLDEFKFFQGLRSSGWEDIFSRIERYSGNELVRELAYALLRARCGYTDYEVMSNLSSVSDEEMENYYREAVCIARDNFKIYDSLSGGICNDSTQ